MAAPARQDAAHRSREGLHRLRRGDQGRAVRRTPLSAMARPHADPRARAARRRRHPAAHQCEPARSPAGVRLHSGEHQVPDAADGRVRPGGGRLDGHRHADLGAVQPAEAAAHLFQAELRASDQSADRSDPRGAGHVARDLHRAAAEPARSRRHLQTEAARGGASDPLQREPGAHPRHRRRRRQPVPHRDARHHLWRRPWRRRHGQGARHAVQARGSCGPLRREHHHPVGPRDRSRPDSDPLAAGDVRRASSSDPLRA